MKTIHIRTCFVYGGGGAVQAGSGGGKLYNAESPKQDSKSKRFKSITKTIHVAHLGMLLYLSMAHMVKLKTDWAN